LVSTSAARQSLKPALVRSLSSFTSFAGMSMTGLLVLILFLSHFDKLVGRHSERSKESLSDFARITI
jgi:hypothetical protein